MKDAALIGMALLLVFTLLSWASAPAAFLTERTLRLDAERKVVLLSTRVAELVPTVVPRRCPQYMKTC